MLYKAFESVLWAFVVLFFSWVGYDLLSTYSSTVTYSPIAHWFSKVLADFGIFLLGFVVFVFSKSYFDWLRE